MRGAVFALLALVQANAAAAAGADAELKAFIADFAAKLGGGGVAAIESLAHFPLKNAVYREKETVSKGEFRKAFAYIADKQFVDCLRKNAPQRAAGASKRLGDWSVDCDGNVFYFAKFESQWRYSGFENVNE